MNLNKLQTYESTIIHLSNTDIRSDSRILKEIVSISKLPRTKVVGIGIKDTEDIDRHCDLDNIISLRVWSINIKYLPRPIRYFFVQLEFFFKSINLIRSKSPDIIHCHDTLFLPIAYFFKKTLKTKLVYDAHELESLKNGQNRILSFVTYYIEKFVWKNIDLFITVSPSINDWYQNKFGSKKSLILLNSPLFNNNFKFHESNYFRNKFNIPNESKIFLYVGLLTEGRSIDLYLKIFSDALINSHVVFMGEGNKVEKIKNYEAKFDNIHYHIPVDHTQVVTISRSADIGLCLIEPISLSDYLCLPNKLFEYSFAGLFVISSDLPSMKLIIEKYKLGICIDINEEDLKNEILKLENIDIPKIEKNISELSWENQSLNLNTVYTYILNN